MKRIVAIISALSLLSFYTFAQGELGIGLGTTNFFGDVTRKSPKGNTYFSDIVASMTRPAGAIYYQYTFNPRFTIKASLSMGEFEGDDLKSNSAQIHDDGWYRSYRNLSFRSRVIELGITGQFNILKYTPGSMGHRWTPYVFAGISVFNFDPKAYYNGQWIRLQPLGTEGQGMSQYPDRKKYSLIQPAIPVGFGFKYNVNKAISVGLEVGHRITFTDYLDDVSKSYPGKDDIYAYYGKDRADLVYALSRRSVEKDPEGRYAAITDKGNPRGNPKGNDAFLFSMVTVTYNISKMTRREHDAFGRRKIQKYRRVFH